MPSVHSEIRELPLPGISPEDHRLLGISTGIPFAARLLSHRAHFIFIVFHTFNKLTGGYHLIITVPTIVCSYTIDEISTAALFQ